MLTRQAPPTDFKWQADNIRALRTHLGLSQTALSREIGIRQQTISEWETGMYAPRGASVTILTLLAVSSNFQFEADRSDNDKIRPLLAEEQSPRPSQGLAPRRLADSGPVPARSEQPAQAQRLTFEAAKAAQTDRRTGTYNSTYFESRPSAAVRRLEVPM
ncbi:helix-turn-helix domain-containing protein [Candidatus Lucifugimonas marina]|uniref:Helix-turn-helix domain-containing protein n=1 Tax=Candidatus Lucifugimonas marina TaxID=3038979 RepID=A0AAJ5ZJK0_9CHLR|nr:helix-turn-helix domain-containing protein [SAR202 cluster bacterium JH702]MDG0870653.1 helix-turn-helix domain-containing protein [SAR202 cluster bacterium JH639]WFG36597.1 helix-turn-helix domain-containing protein [SAR202 cluster bacterium JH545]WFG40530.1 helix-turn-helix domain-containing protein [SAR202 cluster bacterium JH1073]